LINVPVDNFNLKFPLTRGKHITTLIHNIGVFNQWVANDGASVFLKSKFILTP